MRLVKLKTMSTEISQYKGYTIKVWDDSVGFDNPNSWSDIKVAYFHNQCWIPYGSHTSETIGQALRENPNQFEGNKRLVPLYAHIHSGVQFSLHRGTDRWDTSLSGCLIVPETATEQEIEYCVQDWNDYFLATPSGFTIYDGDECNIDSCGGYYSPDDAHEAARSFIDTL